MFLLPLFGFHSLNLQIHSFTPFCQILFRRSDFLLKILRFNLWFQSNISPCDFIIIVFFPMFISHLLISSIFHSYFSSLFPFYCFPFKQRWNDIGRRQSIVQNGFQILKLFSFPFKYILPQRRYCLSWTSMRLLSMLIITAKSPLNQILFSSVTQ